MTRDQALSPWNRSTDSKTLDCQRTNPREYQIVRTHTTKTTWVQDPASLNNQGHPLQDPSSKQQTKQKYKPNHQQTGVPPHSALPIREKTNKQKLTVNFTLYEAHTNHWTNVRRAETKRKKEFNLLQGKNSLSFKPGKKRPQTQYVFLENEKAERYYTNEETN